MRRLRARFVADPAELAAEADGDAEDEQRRHHEQGDGDPPPEAARPLALVEG